MHPPRKSRKHFTITEILISLVVLATVSSLAIPAWFSRSEVTLDSAARLLARDLRHAQNRSAFERLVTGLSFSPDGTGYTVVDETGFPVPAPLGPGDYRRYYPHDAVFRGVRVESADFAGQSMAKFDKRGSITEGGTIVLSFGGESRTLSISARSGMIEISGMSKPWIDNGL